MHSQGAQWHDTADIIVVGYGRAGAVAAITTHDLGAEVLIVEKQPADRHCTTTQLSGGALISVTDPVGTTSYMTALAKAEDGGEWTDVETLSAWVRYSQENREWLEQLGGHLKLRRRGGEHRELPGWESLDVYRFAGSGLGLHRFLTDHVARRDIRVMYGAAAQKLLTDHEGRVVGVRLAPDERGQQREIRARRAVIMATGGFEYDDPMKLQFLKAHLTYFTGAPAATGDGIRMTMALGTEMWHMNCCSARAVAKFPDFPVAFSVRLPGTPGLQNAASSTDAEMSGEPRAGYVLVDRNGRRFTSEEYKGHSLYYELVGYDSQRLLYPRVPCYWILDQRRMESGPLV